jgi:branched-chain amino acid aminotransferase
MLAGRMADLCNVDGTISREQDARIPVLDRGFLFGDSVYEVMRTRGGSLFAWQEHLARLRGSARGIGLEPDLDDAAILRRIDATLREAGNAESYVRVILTRGTGTAPNIDLAYAPGPPRWIVLVRELTAHAGSPVRLQLVGRLRNDPRALDPAVKSGNYLNNVLGLREAKVKGATDCLFLNASGHVTEASTANVFAVHGARVRTPPLDAGILAGVTRALLLEFLRARGGEVAEADLTPADLHSADELFLTSTLRDLAPVTHIDGAPVGGGMPGPFVRALAREFTARADRRAREQDGPAMARLVGAQ